MKRYEILVFLTGAVTLSLELLASRIMIPFFGVSLFIWAGVLSVTLAFLAIGYYYGGELSRSGDRGSLEARLLALPIVSAASIAVAAALYPALFPYLARVDLILGSFVGAGLLLALPLIALSAMNPLLIGVQRTGAAKGDVGAGRIFFISTLGSVVGVLLTAFAIIPNVTNYRAMLALAVIMCCVVWLMTRISRTVPRRQRRSLSVAAPVVALLCVVLLLGKSMYLNVLDGLTDNALWFDLREEYTSLFGNIKVADAIHRDGNGSPERYFLQDGMVQNRATPENASASMYTYVLESLVHAYSPNAKDVVVLGLGAGMVSRHLRSDGLNVSVVEINPMALRAATEHFGFQTSSIEIYLEDARTFVRRCRSSFDVAVVDLFLGDNTPDYVLTEEFFKDLSQCVRSGGAMVMNAVLSSETDEGNRRLLATIASAFPRLFVSGLPDGNIFIVGTLGTVAQNLSVEAANLPDDLSALVEYSVTGSRPVSPMIYQYWDPISDEHNTFSVLFADTHLRTRESLVRMLPPSMLVN